MGSYYGGLLAPQPRGEGTLPGRPMAGKGVSLSDLNVNLHVLATPENGFV